MKNISIFDVIGPNMIGPSSSHTAGALRIALLAYKIAKKDVKKATFVLYGSFAKTYRGHGTDRALLAGIMGFGTEDERIRDAYKLVEAAGIKYKFEINESKAVNHPNTVDIILEGESGMITTLTGESIGGGNVQITKINGIKVHFTGEYSTLLIRQKDVSGMMAYITKCLSDANINIAFMRLYRTQKGERAYAVIEADQKINEDVLDIILANENIEDARIIETL